MTERRMQELSDYNSDTSEYEKVSCECGRSLFKTFLVACDERGITEESYYCACGVIYHWAYGHVVGKVINGADFLLKRAEDAQSSERNLVAVRNELKSIKEQNKRYREALEFYAKSDIYGYELTYDMADLRNCEVIEDDGRRARKALEGGWDE